MIKNIKNRKGFTLIELLVVIAIIAILAVVVVLTLNPAELLRQARDSNRISDFATLKSALGLYSEDVATTTPMYKSADNIYVSYGSASTTTSTYIGATTSTYGFSTSTNTYLGVTTSTSRAVDSTGWIPINFTLISSGAPIGALPVDPSKLVTTSMCMPRHQRHTNLLPRWKARSMVTAVRVAMLFRPTVEITRAPTNRVRISSYNSFTSVIAKSADTFRRFLFCPALWYD